MKRIGVETFLDKLNSVSRHELYSKACKHPQIYCKTSADLLLDYEFCKLVKVLEGNFVRMTRVNVESCDAGSIVLECFFWFGL